MLSNNKGGSGLISFIINSIKMSLCHIYSFFYLLAVVIRLFLTGLIKPGKVFKRKQIFDQMYHMGIQSIPIVLITSLFLGMTLAMLSMYALSDFGAELWVAGLVGVGFTRELGPLITAIVISGRVGAAISAELGTMQVSEEIDSLTTMGINPLRYLVLPRFLGLLIMLPCLTVISDYFGILGGYLICAMKMDMSWAYYKELTIIALSLKDVITGLVKSLSFAVVISMIGCYQGLIVSGGAEGVGKGTTKSVVNSLIFVIVMDSFFTALFSYVIV
ncbi:ABC transporter permease [bacterium]|nr:ABC transporter permease [bacterium]